MRVTDNMVANNSIYNINKSKQRLNQLNELLSADQNINRPSDDPMATRQLLEVQAQVNSIDRYTSNIANAKTWTSLANNALQAMNGNLNVAKDVANNILNGMNDPSLVSGALANLEGIRKQLIDMGNAQVGDQYVFGGFNSSAPVVTSKVMSGTMTLPANQISGLTTGISGVAGTTVAGSNIVTMVPPAGLMVGMQISGVGIPAQTTVTGINAGNITISNNATAPGGATTLAFGSPPLTVGMSVSGPGIPPNTTITAVTPNSFGLADGSVLISNSPTSAVSQGAFTFGVAPLLSRLDAAVIGGTLPTISGLNTVGPPPLTVGMTVTGPGIPANTTVTNVLAGSVEISNNPTAVSSTGSYVFQAPSLPPLAGSVVKQPTIYGIDTTAPGFAALNTAVPWTVTITPPAGGDYGLPAVTTVVNPAADINASTGPGILDGSVNLDTSSPYFSNPAQQWPWITGAKSIRFDDGVTTYDVTAETATSSLNVPIAGLTVGMQVTGPGLAANTTITNIDGVTGTVNITDYPTIGAAGSYTFTAPSITQPGGTALQSQVLGLGLSGTADLAVGMTVSGAGVPPNTTITSIVNGTDITLSNALTSTVGGAMMSFDPVINKSGTISVDQPSRITGLATTAGLAVGMSVTGTGIPANTFIKQVNANDVVLESIDPATGNRSAVALTLAETTNFAFGATVSTQTANTDHPPNLITGLPSTANLYVGMKISGTGIPPNTTITAINNGTDITISNVPTVTGVNNYTFEGYIDSNNSRTVTGMMTNGSTTVTLPTTANLVAGMLISDSAIPPAIPDGTTIASIVNGTTITLSAPATATSTSPGVSLMVTAVGAAQAITATSTATTVAGTVTTYGSTTITLPGPQLGLMIGTSVTGAGIAPGTVITGGLPGPAITLSLPATATSLGTPVTFNDTRGTVTGANQFSVPSTANLKNGTTVSGAGIPVGTTITVVNGTDFTIVPPAGVLGSVTSLTFTDNRGATTLGSATVTGILTTAGLSKGMIVTGAGIPSYPPTTIVSIAANGTDITLSTQATATAAAPGTALSFYPPGYFAADEVKVNINKSSQVTLNYSGSSLLLGGTPATASQASGPPPSTLPVNILGTIGELMAAIQKKDDAGIRAASSNLKAAADQITLVQTEYAGRATRLDSANTMLANNQETLKGIISSTQTLDSAKTIIQLQQQTTAYQAALQGTAKIMPMSLMDYLR